MSKNSFSHTHALHASRIHAFSPSVSYSRSLPPEVKIPHQYGTRANTKRRMAEEDQRLSKVEGDVAEVRGNVEKIIEMMKALSFAANAKAQEATTSAMAEPAGPRLQNAWPEFGLPPNFTPAGYQEPVHEAIATNVQAQNAMKFQIPVTTAGPKFAVHTPFGNEDPQYLFDTPRSEIGSATDELEDVKEKYQTLEKRMRAMEGNDVFGAAAMDMCLVPDLVLPKKFKTPDFEKYKGHTCPRSHLIMYYRKMTAYARNDKLLIHCFQDSL